MKRADKNGDGRVSEVEFVDFALRHECTLIDAFVSLGPAATEASVRSAIKRLGLAEDGQGVDEAVAQFLHGGAVSQAGSSPSAAPPLPPATLNDFRTLVASLDPTSASGLLAKWDGAIMLDGDSGAYVASGGPHPWKLLVAGAVAGAVSRTMTAPLDRIKLTLQLSGAQRKEKATLVGATREIYAEGGLRAFFRGNGTNVIKIAPESAIKLTAYDVFRKSISRDPESPSSFERFLAGSLAGVVSQALVYPLEITKTRLAVTAPGTYNGIADCLTKIFRQEGPAALFRGVGPSLLGIIPYAGVELMTYSTLRDYHAAWTGSKDAPTPVVLACAAFSSSVGQLCSYPLALIRTRMQAQGAPNRPVVYKSSLDCLIVTVKNEGAIRGLYKGMGVSYLKALPAVSISFAVFESVKKLL